MIAVSESSVRRSEICTVNYDGTHYLNDCPCDRKCAICLNITEGDYISLDTKTSYHCGIECEEAIDSEDVTQLIVSARNWPQLQWNSQDDESNRRFKWHEMDPKNMDVHPWQVASQTTHEYASGKYS
ncbi:hypothetical protein KIN20_030410 [Parelaphostrongylus tenuis]|uniref:Uncharacterized protein n=1 Tax=Parelaphostrongylus tenuis TaxID=148309 RepID=A0AAD5R3Q1_PARTN|nr:hypothetical protein KIN20_030410 [Parelaphostrongylus tenuis]